MPQYWTLLNENILVWFSLIQGLLLPFCLYISDEPFRIAFLNAFKRKQSADFSDLLFSKSSSSNQPPGIAGTLPGYSFAPSSYLTALSDDFCRAEDASLLRIYHSNNLGASNSSLNGHHHLDTLTTRNSLNNNSTAKQQSIAFNRNNSLHALQYSNSNPIQFNQSPPFNQSFSSPFNCASRLPGLKKFVSSNSVNQNGYHPHSYANNDFLLLDKPLLNGPFSGAIHANAPDPRRSSFSCFLSSNGFPGYSTIAEKQHYYSQNKLNNELYNKATAELLPAPTIKCYQQLFTNSVKFEQQLNTLNNAPNLSNYVACVSNGKLHSSSYNHMTKTNPVYLTNEHFLPNSRKSVATSEIAYTGNEKEIIDKLKLEQRKSLCENVSYQTKELINNQFNKQFRFNPHSHHSHHHHHHHQQQNRRQISRNLSSSNLYDSPQNSLECSLQDQLNSLATASSSDGNGDYQSLISKNLIKPNGKFKCSRLANVGLLSNVASLSQTGASQLIGTRMIQHQSKMSRLLGNRKLDLKQVANRQKQRRSFSGEINCELLNSLDSVDEDQTDCWPQLIEEQEISKSDTERDGCETIFNFSIKNQAITTNQHQQDANSKQQHVYGCLLDDKSSIIKNTKCKIDDLSLKRPKLIVDDQLNLVDIENAIRNSTNLLNLSVFNVASDEEDQAEEMSNKLELLKNIKDKKDKKKSVGNEENANDDFELANDDFEFHTTKSINSNATNKNENKTKMIQPNLKESNSFKEIKLAKQDSTKINGLFKKNSKNESKINHANKLESDYRRKSITSITPLCSNQNRALLNNKLQSKSVSDLTAQFENCIQNKPLHNLNNSNKNLSGKRSTSECNLIADDDKTNLLPTSTALMLQLIRQSNQQLNEQTPPTKLTSSETMTRKKRTEIRKQSSTSSSDTNYSDDLARRQNRYLKKDEQKVKKELILSKQSMLPVPSNNSKKDILKDNLKSTTRLQQPPHFRLLSASGLNLSNNYKITQQAASSDLLKSHANKSTANYQIKSTPITILNNNSPNSPVLRKYQQQQQTVIYQPIYRSSNSLINSNGLPNGLISNNNFNLNRPYQQQSVVQKHRLSSVNKQQNRDLELRRSNSTTSLALDQCLTSLNKSMPNLITQSNLFPYNFQ